MGANHTSSGVMYKYLTTSTTFSEVSVDQITTEMFTNYGNPVCLSTKNVSQFETPPPPPPPTSNQNDDSELFYVWFLFLGVFVPLLLLSTIFIYPY